MSRHEHPIQRMLTANAQWAEDVQRAEPSFFEQSAKGQSPHTLWIGCADSRVPDSIVTGSKPGEIFVHRNIANQLKLDDYNALSVLRYAVDYLGVEHVVVVGHTECGGAAACLAAAQDVNLDLDKPIATVGSLPPDSSLNRWLEPLTRLAVSLELSSTPHEEALPLVVEENVKMQVENLAKTHAITEAWTKGTRKGQDVWIHGWVYDISTGKLRDLNVSRGPPPKKPLAETPVCAEPEEYIPVDEPVYGQPSDYIHVDNALPYYYEEPEEYNPIKAGPAHYGVSEEYAQVDKPPKAGPIQVFA